MEETERQYIAIDLKSFYASVECVERGLDPLDTNLVVADVSRTDKTICLAVTPPLKKLGVGGRCRVFELNQKIEEIKRMTGRTVEYIAAPPRMKLYADYSGQIYSVYLKYVSKDDIHVYSVDECFIDVTDYLKMYKMTAMEVAQMMIHDVFATTGITATAGIGTNLYLAKVAMDIVAKKAEPDEYGVRTAELDERKYRELLWEHTPITDFWRVGAGTAKRLESMGMYTMGDIALQSERNEDMLYRMFGIDAEILIDHAWGFESCTMNDIKEYRPYVNSLSSGQVLPCPYTKEKGELILKEMTDLLVLDMVDKELCCDSFTIHIGYDRENVDNGYFTGDTVTDFYGRKVPKSSHGSVKLGAATSSTKIIIEALSALYRKITVDGLTVRRINITANNVVKQSFMQYDLFELPGERVREQSLQKTVLAIKKRYGKNAILKGMNYEDGAKTIERNGQIGGHKA